jgi:predicted kinase
MPTAHLICGSTCAGKTTYAKALADRLGGIRLSADEWMVNLFLPDRPEPMSVAWAIDRAARCELQMWSVADQLLGRRIDVVFDVGLSRREHRERFRSRATQAGAKSKLHYLDVDCETRRQRARLRNEDGGAKAPFIVTDAMFDWMDRSFEAPDDDELYGAMIVCS